MSITLKYKNYLKQNINKFLLSKGYSDNNIYYLIKNKNVLVNNNIVKDKNYLLTFNNEVIVTLNDEENTLIPYLASLDIVGATTMRLSICFNSSFISVNSSNKLYICSFFILLFESLLNICLFLYKNAFISCIYSISNSCNFAISI